MRRVVCAAVGVAVSVSACSGPAPPPIRPVGDVKQLMQFVVEPAADVYWDGVGTIVDQSGVTEFKPETEGEWDALIHSAYTIAESGNLLMIGARPRDGGEWMQLSRAMVDVGEKAIRAAESRDPQAVFDVGAEVYDTCTACHARYAVELARPNTQP
ncbi:MAG: hypothetical protein AB7U83_23855 [Vicinamibacterales bacterium]